MNRPAISLDVVSNLQPLEYSSGFFRGSGMQRIIVVTLLGVFVSLFPILSAYATTCEPNQYLDNGFCYTCPANATCDGTNFTCANGWYKNGGICQRCSVENSSCTGPDDYSCLPGFYDDNGTCAACPENANCAGGHEYFYCKPGYYKYQTNCNSCAGHVCDGDTLISCGAGYYKTNRGGYYCQKCESFEYCPAGATTRLCIEGYYQNGNLNCRQCPTGYYCPLGTKYTEIHNHCASGYYRTGGSCTKCPDDIICPGGIISEMTCPDGLYKHDNGQCLSYAPGDCGVAPNCNPGCWNNGGTCTPCIAENATCTNGTDFTCMAGYYKNGTVCDVCPENSDCLAGSTQISCLPGYYLKNNSCLQCGTEAVYCINNIRYECPQYIPGSMDKYLPNGHTVLSTTSLNALDNPVQSTINMCSLNQMTISEPRGIYALKWVRWDTDAYHHGGLKYWLSANTGYYLINLVPSFTTPTYETIAACTNAAENSYYTGSGSVGGNDCPWLCNDGYYRDGNECLVCPDGLECVGGGIICPAGMYADKNQCVSCPAGYSDAPDGGAQSVNSCQKRCDGGYYVATAQSDKCENVGTGFWIGENYTNYGATGLRNACDAGMTTIGYGRGADDANDCGRVLNVGNTQIYLRRNKITTPSLVVRYNDDLLYGNMDTTERGNLRIQIGDTVYSVYDESML